MELIYNENWQSPDQRFLICEPMRAFDEVDQESGLFISKEEMFPVRWIPEAEIWMVRLAISDLWERKQNKKDPAVADREHRLAVNRHTEAEADAWARDVGWWHFKKYADQYNFGSLGRFDPSRKVKMMQDKLGRDLKR